MKKRLKRLLEQIIEGILFLSSTTTTIVVLLIIIFIFTEGFGIFRSNALEGGMKLAVNNQNPVKELSSEEIMNVFDRNITNWKELGGNDAEIVLFSMDELENYFTEEELGKNLEFIPLRISQLLASSPNMIAYFPSNYMLDNFQGHEVHLKNITVKKFLSNHIWLPTAEPAAQLGAWPLILGTLWVSLGAILFALPLGLATAIYMAEIADERVRRVLKPVIELLAGIPSVVYGFFGLVVVVPLIQKWFNLPVGETGLTGSIILGIMALPTIISVSEDSLRTIPQSLKEASLALGASKWQTIYRVVVPYAISGISAAAILGIGRAIGETMAVLMVTGNAAVIPNSLLEPLRTIPATIAAELGEAPQGGLHFKALFALGAILFLMTMIINIVVEYISQKNRFKKMI